ncbi:MAG: hypothetical protein MR415_04380 [Coriobacteriaceae bacterium]|nr:hypothetical protein [Coriobacteriaceae bacterium]MDD7584540.1 hypothetical protein [Coriobacteriaceae bacterium]
MRHGRMQDHSQNHLVRMGGRVVAIAAAAAIAATLAAPAAALAEGATLWRLYNPYDGQHLLTTDRGEYDSLQPLGWRGEGEAWESPDAGDPVYRLYNPYNGEHLYTGDAGEYASLAAIGWRQEGVAFRSEASGGDPVYRLFNPYEQVGTHLLTTSASEYESLAGAGWVQEGVAFRAAHTHDWEPVYQSVWVQDSAAWDEPTYSTVVKYRCNGAAGVKDEHGNVVKPHVDCGKTFDSLAELEAHGDAAHPDFYSYSTVSEKVQTGTKHHDATGHYEQQVTGYRCAGCGATK